MEQQLFGDNQTFELMLRRVRDLPALPDVVSRILSLLEKPDVPASEIAKLVSYDPGLTSKFLRMVNSAAYGFQRQISSVQHAIMILGFSSVRGVVLSASIFKIFQGQGTPGIDPASFWKHSIGTAIASRIIASHWKFPYAEDAFSAGMLHDIGKLVFDYYFSAYYKRVTLQAKQNRIPFHGADFIRLEKEVLGSDHADIGYHLALRWKLPATFSEVIRYHHSPIQAEDASQLVYVVALANAFSRLIQENYGVFDASFIQPEILNFFYPDEDEEGGENRIAHFENLFKQVASEMDGVEEFLRTLKA